MFSPNPEVEPRCAANDVPGGPAATPDVPLIALVDLLAEAYVARLAANDNVAPPKEA